MVVTRAGAWATKDGYEELSLYIVDLRHWAIKYVISFPIHMWVRNVWFWEGTRLQLTLSVETNAFFTEAYNDFYRTWATCEAYARSSSFVILKLAISMGSNVGAPNADGDSPLRAAIREGNFFIYANNSCPRTLSVPEKRIDVCISHLCIRCLCSKSCNCEQASVRWSPAADVWWIRLLVLLLVPSFPSNRRGIPPCCAVKSISHCPTRKWTNHREKQFHII